MIAPLNPITEARPSFPALLQDIIYADNAGGSQCTTQAANAISEYLLNYNVQLGAAYSVSRKSSEKVGLGAINTAPLIGASSPKSIVYGSSCTQIVENLARAFESTLLSDRDTLQEIVLAEEHECNVGPWVNMVHRLQKVGVKIEIKWWKHEGTIEEENVRLSLEGLSSLLTEKTKLVAFSACSNILGELTDIEGVVEMVRLKTGGKAKTCLDCVAYSPHRRMTVEKWKVDFAFFSYYKVFGPHCSVLYASPSSLASLSSLAHFFLDLSTSVDPYKLMPGGSSYEIVYGSSVVPNYILSLAGTKEGTEDERFDLAFERIALHEELLSERLLNYLKGKRERGVRILGPKGSGKAIRAPTISFVVRGEKPLGSRAIVEEMDKTNIGIRYGNFYAVRLCKQIQLDEDDGVVRISFVHYNTLEEVDEIIKALDIILV